MTTLTIMRALPREVDPVVYNMLHEDPGNVSYSAVGGLSDQIRELRESIELPLMNPELFLRVGIKPPKVMLSCNIQLVFVDCHMKGSLDFAFNAGCSPLWTSWYWQNLVGSSHCQQHRCKFLEGLFCYFWNSSHFFCWPQHKWDFVGCIKCYRG